jgi:hypothetical protein
MSRVYTLILFLIVGCAIPTTTIYTKPAGAKIYVDGEYVGVSPKAVDLECWFCNQREITAKKEGFEDGKAIAIQERIRRNTTGTSFGTAVVNNPNSGNTGFATGSTSGFQSTVEKRWPTEVRIELQPLDAKEKDDK